MQKQSKNWPGVQYPLKYPLPPGHILTPIRPLYNGSVILPGKTHCQSWQKGEMPLKLFSLSQKEKNGVKR